MSLIGVVTILLIAWLLSSARRSVNLRTVGIACGTLSIEPDDLAEDNVRYLRVAVRRALRVVVVSDASRADARSPAFFLAKAIVPSRSAVVIGWGCLR